MVNRLSFRGIPLSSTSSFAQVPWSLTAMSSIFRILMKLSPHLKRQKRFKTYSIQFYWSDLVALTMKSHSGQKCSRLFLRSFFRTTSLDVVSTSEMQINPSRIDIVLERFLLVGREFILRVENFFTCRNFMPVENFLLDEVPQNVLRIINNLIISFQ